MFLDNSFPYRTSFGIHVIVGLSIGVSLSFILLVLGPFGTDSFEHEFKFALLAGYGLIKFIVYLIAHIIENNVFLKDKIWNWGREITFQILFGLSAIFFAYLYQEYVINEHSISATYFVSFLFYIALPIFPILVIPTVLLRFALVKTSNESKEIKESPRVNQPKKIIELKGENTTDVLIVDVASLLFVKSVDNYVKVFYQGESGIENRILRSTLSSMMIQADFLWQPHRSYLINPRQDFILKGNSQKAFLALKGFSETIPVARSSYRKLKLLLQFNPIG